MRVTLDWDDGDAKQANLDAARSAAEGGLGEPRPWELRRSSSGDGFHFIAYDMANDTASGFERMMNLRELWGDDEKRLRLDRKRWEAGSPFMQVLYRRKYMSRSDFPSDGEGYSTGNVVDVIEQSDAVKAAPESERVKTDGRINYRRLLELAREKTGLTQAEVADKTKLKTYAKEDGGISRSTVSAYERGQRPVAAESLKRWLRRIGRSRGIGHYAETDDGGEAADEVRYIDDGDQRRTLVEYIDVPMGIKESGKGKEYGNLDEEDREYALLNTHTGSYNPNHTDAQLHAIHDDVTDHVMEIFSPTSPDGTELNLSDRNDKFNVDGWSREPDSVNYEREYLDPNEDEVYLSNMPNQGRLENEPGNQPIFEVILWDEDMTELIWHCIGIWAGSGPSDAIILKDRGIGSWEAA